MKKEKLLISTEITIFQFKFGMQSDGITYHKGCGYRMCPICQGDSDAITHVVMRRSENDEDIIYLKDGNYIGFSEHNGYFELAEDEYNALKSQDERSKQIEYLKQLARNIKLAFNGDGRTKSMYEVLYEMEGKIDKLEAEKCE